MLTACEHSYALAAPDVPKDVYDFEPCFVRVLGGEGEGGLGGGGVGGDFYINQVFF